MSEPTTKKKNNSSLSAYTERPIDVHFSAQEPDEEILLLLRRHPLTNVSWVLIFIFLLAFPVITEILLRETPLDPLQIPFRLRLLFSIFWYLFWCRRLFWYFLSWCLVCRSGAVSGCLWFLRLYLSMLR